MLPEIKLLSESNKPLTVSELAKRTGKSQPTVSKNLERARRKGLVKQLADKTYVSVTSPSLTKIDPYIAAWSAQFTASEAPLKLLKLAHHLASQSKALEAKILSNIQTGSRLTKGDLDTRSMLAIRSEDSD